MKILHLLRKLLLPLSMVYGGVMAVRNVFYRFGIFKSYSFDIPIICVGNLSVGGTGKTPHIELLIETLSAIQNVAVLSRGYGRKTKGFRVVYPNDNAKSVGDESLQIKQKYPYITVAVDENRVHGIQELLALKNPPEVVLLDDAFQHRRLKPGLQILLDNFNRPIHQDFVLPAGNLREFKAGKKRADIVVVTKCVGITEYELKSFQKKYVQSGYGNLFFSHFKYLQPHPVFTQENDVLAMPILKGAQVLIVTGIANPMAFEQYIATKCEAISTLRFPDHHSFSELDESDIIEAFNKLTNAQKYLITTEKDAMRFNNLHNIKKQFSRQCYYIPVQVDFLFDGAEGFKQKITNYVRKI